MSELSFQPEDYRAFGRYLEDSCGLVLGDNKDYLVANRLNGLMAELSVATLKDLISRAHGYSGSPLRERIIDAMTTNETMWFRDAYPFDMFAQVILPELAKRRLSQLRVWSAACSTGEEAYSISMVIREFQQANAGALPGNVQITATDIDSTVLNQARSASYDGKSLARGISDGRRQRFFEKTEDRWTLKSEVSQLVNFQPLNLKESYSALGKFEVIFCRNVLIYFSSELKKDIVTRMVDSLNPGAYLLMGAAEAPTSYCDDFTMLRGKPGVAYQLKKP
ncbi:MAG TPA: protein-glutamate O-methyltransferase CheR [Acidiferrobacteraceae bacterium]|nr:protein-glutamate O-methyltransferase CheR [Acidiferrobacteraceae bacterium]